MHYPGGDNPNKGKQIAEVTKASEVTEAPNDKVVGEKNKSTAIPKKLKEWEKAYNNSEIHFVDIKYLSKNAQYFKGQVVICASKVYEVNDDNLQFDTDDSNFFKEVTCRFKNTKDLSGLEEKDKVCFIGEVASIDTYFGNDTVTIKNCYIVAKGKGVSEYQKKIKNNAEKQKKYVSNTKSKAKEAKKQEAEKNKSSYIEKCKKYSYKSIQRHPDKYKGKKIKISGTVIQVMEGWFDTVSLRVEDSSGNIWYVDYRYSDNEAKILENDKITVYGESTGTETYTTILGNSQTIPSIDAKYIK